jgi:hypothetical protein
VIQDKDGIRLEVACERFSCILALQEFLKVDPDPLCNPSPKFVLDYELADFFRIMILAFRFWKVSALLLVVVELIDELFHNVRNFDKVA